MRWRRVFALEDFVEAPHVALLVGERSAHERRDDLAYERGADDAAADAQDVHVVVLDALARRVGVVAGGRPHARDLIGRDAGADPAPAGEDAALDFAGGDGVGEREDEVGVVVRRVIRRRAVVDDLVAEPPQDIGGELLGLEAGVVAGHSNAHVGSLSGAVSRDALAW